MAAASCWCHCAAWRIQACQPCLCMPGCAGLTCPHAGTVFDARYIRAKQWRCTRLDLASIAPIFLGGKLEYLENKVFSMTIRQATTALLLGLSMSVPTLPAAKAQAAAVVRGLPDFTELVEQVGPSVVNIRTSEKVRTGNGQGSDEEMQELFKRFLAYRCPMRHASRLARTDLRPKSRNPRDKARVLC